MAIEMGKNMDNAFEALEKTFEQAELIYRAELAFIDEVDFGLTMQDLMSGQRSIPPAGVRFDQRFEGRLLGPKLTGTIEGTDYLRLGADGNFKLHLHGRLITAEGATMALASEGVSIPEDDGRGRLRSTVRLHCADERYRWVNRRPLWALGLMDPQQRRALVVAYSI